MDQERFNHIRLARSQNVGPVVYRQLLRRFGSAGAALKAISTGKDGAGGGRTIIPADEREIAQEIERTYRLDAQYMLPGDMDYPPLLAQIADAPLVLIRRGNPALAAGRLVAMVGARNASAAACRFARTLARDLSARGVVVVSGLARGIDTAAHHGALAGIVDGANDAAGGTISVIASGIDIAYPPENAALQENIAHHGLLLTEHPPGTEPKARYFPNRNRIIAGLSCATLVVEAAPQSGSLITARMAGDYGRDVLAVPGSPLDPRAHGCNDLIRNGATLIQSADDVMEAISSFNGAARYNGLSHGGQGGFAFDEAERKEPDSITLVQGSPHAQPRPHSSPENEEAASILSALGPVPVSVDELIRQTGLDPATVQMALMDLEMAGRLERHSGARISLKP
ncbi:MAG: DNA-protecting protein DprA [Sphingobium sp.]|nr:DNA-protecting protein DprA [Sphingobium sp.]